MENFKEMNCGECGIVFFVPVVFYRERRERNLGWSCPNGHERIFKETESDKLKRELGAEIKRKEDLVEHWRKKFECCNEKLPVKRKRGGPRKTTAKVKK